VLEFFLPNHADLFGKGPKSNSAMPIQFLPLSDEEYERSRAKAKLTRTVQRIEQIPLHQGPSNDDYSPVPASIAAAAGAQRVPLVANNRSFGWLSNNRRVVVKGRRRFGVGGFHSQLFGALHVGFMLSYQVRPGVGVWGNRHPGNVGLDIGQLCMVDRHLAMRGTLISAILFCSPALATGCESRRQAMTISPLCAPEISGHASSVRVWYDGAVPDPECELDFGANSRSPLRWMCSPFSTYFTDLGFSFGILA